MTFRSREKNKKQMITYRKWQQRSIHGITVQGKKEEQMSGKTTHNAIHFHFDQGGKEKANGNRGKLGYIFAKEALTGGAVTDIRVEFERKCRIS